MKKTTLAWILILVFILFSLQFFVLLYVWIDMSSSLSVYASYAGTLQAASDYQKGDLLFYKNIGASDENTVAEIKQKQFIIKEYSIGIFDFSGRYGMKRYAEAYNSKIEQLYCFDNGTASDAPLK